MVLAVQALSAWLECKDSLLCPRASEVVVLVSDSREVCDGVSLVQSASI